MSSVFYDLADITKWLGARTVAKARDYAHAVSNLHWENNTLSGEVQGTQRYPYVVDVHFHDVGDELWVEGDCSCPVGFQCKHIAAVLFAGLEENRLKPIRRAPRAGAMARNLPRSRRKRVRRRPATGGDGHHAGLPAGLVASTAAPRNPVVQGAPQPGWRNPHARRALEQRGSGADQAAQVHFRRRSGDPAQSVARPFASESQPLHPAWRERRRGAA